MFKNKEISYFIILTVVITICSCICFNRFPEYGILLITIDSIVITLLYLWSTFYRYMSIRKLSIYLRRLQQELTYMEVPDHREGELGVLKSELYKITLKLRSQSELIKKDKDFLADALSDISHQLKTPLTSMDVMVDLLKDPDLPSDKRREFTDRLHKQLMRMEWLVSSLLTMSKMDAGRIAFKEEPVNAIKMITLASDHLLIPMELKEQQFHISGNKEAVYSGDMQWSSEAVSNILKNCMEHTKKGGCISVHCAENALYTEIQITDNGEGIAESELPHIFERFYKGAHASPFSAGIGLALAKQIITKQNGTIQAESLPEKYTTFRIKFYKK